MSLNYKYLEANMSDLLLDDENPRFASSMLINNSNKVSQEIVIGHLLKYADIKELAKRIDSVHELHGSELITCYKKDDTYVVIEGNRRACACKLLLNRDLIPDEHKLTFPVIRDETKDNIKRITINVYPDRESIQAYLSDRHIKGVKKWSSFEKQNYYMNLYATYNDLNKVAEHTSDSVSIIKKSIRKYQFFMDVFNVLKIEYKNIDIENLDYLPLVDRFMDTVLGNDLEVGLNIEVNESNLKYHSPNDKKEVYNKILLLIGQAFLIRKDKKSCINCELSKIVSTEIYGFTNQKTLIIEDLRIPGLYKLIKEYKNIINEDTYKKDVPDKDQDENAVGGSCGERKDNNEGFGNEENSNEGGTNEKENGSDDDINPIDNCNQVDETQIGNAGNSKFAPKVKYNPKKTPMEYLCFSNDAAKSFKIGGDSNYQLKISSLISDLARFSVYKHPYTCALLYRSLLEATAKMIFERYGSNIKQEYKENALADNLVYLNDNFLFNNVKSKAIPKIRKAIKDNLTTTNIVEILNLYIHFGNQVDEALLLSSWKTMNIFIATCLEK